MRLTKHSGAAATTAALFIFATATAPVVALAAANFSVTPLRLDLRAEQLAAPLTIGNRGTEAVTVQSELLQWTQDGGDDRYSPAEGLLVSPPIVKIAPAAQQVMRVGRIKRGPAPERELAFRLKLAEVPPAASLKQEQISTILQISLPLFIPPADKKATAKLDLQPVVLANGDLRIKVSNSGLVHGKLTLLSLSQDGKSIGETGLNYYVLAGANRELVWPGALKSAAPGAVELKIQLDNRRKVVLHTLKVESAAPALEPAQPDQP